jgi:DNA-binding LacI/PurR family transcriptional regulator
MDDIEMSAYTDPPLTTLRVAKDEMGRLAAAWLIDLIEGDGAGRTVAPVAGELVIRGTCGGTPVDRAPGVSGALATRPTVSTTEGA